jgi:ribonuclease P protein component
MLSKKNRLSSKDFPVLFNKGKKVSNKDFFGRYFTEKSENTALNIKISVITSAKLSKKAVVRNRNRRVVYASLRRIWPLISGKLSNINLSLTPKRDLSIEKPQNLDDSLNELISLIRL